MTPVIFLAAWRSGRVTAVTLNFANNYETRLEALFLKLAKFTNVVGQNVNTTRERASVSSSAAVDRWVSRPEGEKRTLLEVT